MSIRAAKRSFSLAALESWVERLAVDWEVWFSAEVLSAAQAIYRRREIREIAVFAEEATVYGEWNGEAAHAVLGWQGGRLVWRTTLERPLWGETLAVAGLYEVEELIADELADRALYEPPVVAEENSEKEKATGKGEESPELAKEFVAEEVLPEEIAAHELVLVFSESGGGILCVPEWAVSGKRQRIAAYGAQAVSTEDLAVKAREALLRLMTHARKGGFAFDRAVAGWRLVSPTAVAHFVERELPRWMERWRTEGAEEIRLLGRELPPLEMEAVVEQDEAGDFQYRWRLGWGDEWLPEETVRRLLAEHGGSVLVPGKGMARLGVRQRAVLADWPEEEEALPRYQLLSLFGEERIRVRAEGGLREWRDALLAEPEAVENLPEFLRPYQTKGVAWLAHMLRLGTHPLLADEMGLGKTVQVLALLHLKPLQKPALIVCPASVVPVWEAEAARFFPETEVRVLRRGSDFAKDPAPRIWLASYNQLRRNQALLARTEFSFAVLDEAQAIKNPDAKVTEACCAIQAEQRLALTGTPMENHPRDIWSIFRFLMPGLLGKRTLFEARMEGDPEAVGRLARQVAPFVLRRTKTVVARDLPPKVVMPLLCPLSEVQREAYRRLVEEGVATFGDVAPEELLSGQGGISLLALLMRLRQAACDPGLLPGGTQVPVSASGKINVLLERLAEIVANGRKVVVFSQFVSLLNRVEGALQKHFPAVPLFKLTGATADRATPVEHFQKAEGAGIILVSLRAGGTGITLHSAEYVFLLDPWWNPAVEAQAVDRVHRIGQKKATFVYRMIAAETVEARVEALKAAKAELFARVVGELPDMSDWSQHFPSLRALIG